MTNQNVVVDKKSSHVGRQVQLPLRNAIKIAWQNIRVRIGRSILVTSGIILAVSFLSYIFVSDALTESVLANADQQQIEQLQRDGIIAADSADAAIQTRWMVGLALLISFVGVLNSMLLSVTERFKEIGTMKCLGALDGLVVRLFLIESTFQGIVGTSLGIVIGLLLAILEASVTYGSILSGLIPVTVILTRVGICLLAGTLLTVLGALYPAWLAARMEPVCAMRLEV